MPMDSMDETESWTVGGCVQVVPLSLSLSPALCLSLQGLLRFPHLTYPLGERFGSHRYYSLVLARTPPHGGGI